MDWKPSRCSLDDERARTAKTVVFVDVDGVLNVGARDDTEPLLINDEGIEDATKLWGRRKTHPMRDTIDKLVSISKRELGHGEEATYAKFACQGDAMVSDVLVSRLAKIIEAAGQDRIVVLSSKWQQYENHIKRLEKHIGDHLGTPFTFEARTGIELACTAECRLQTVGSFLEGLCSFRGENAGPMRILVLEDFHITAMDGWTCRGAQMTSVAAAEQYLRCRMPAASTIAVKLVHTYDEFKTEDGLLVQLGAGLNLAQLSEAESFLRGEEAEEANAENVGADAANGKRKQDDNAADGAPADEQRPPSKALKLFKAPELKAHNSDGASE